MEERELTFEEWLETEYRPISGGGDPDDVMGDYVDAPSDNGGGDDSSNVDEGTTDGDESSADSSAEPTQGTDGGGEAQAKAPEAKLNPFGRPYYQPGELRGIPLEQIDTSRIPDELQPFYRDIMSHANRKFEVAAQQRRAATMSPEDQAYDAYLRDPRGTISAINGEIEKLTKEDPYDPAIMRLHSLKDTLRERKGTDEAKRTTVASMHQKHNEYLASSIPDYFNKRQAIIDFGSSKGFAEHEMQVLANPATLVILPNGQTVPLGKTAAKITMLVNEFREIMDAGRTAREKVEKPTPAPSAKGGSGSQPSGNASATSKSTFDRARNSGSLDDWAAHMAAKRAAK